MYINKKIKFYNELLVRIYLYCINTINYFINLLFYISPIAEKNTYYDYFL